MATVFLYQCPTLGLRVQGWADDAGAEDNAYEAVACAACGRTHLVNPICSRQQQIERITEPHENSSEAFVDEA
jgi:hypothetical protein